MDPVRPRIPTPWEISNAKIYPFEKEGSLKKCYVISGSSTLYYGKSHEDCENWLALQKRVQFLWNKFLFKTSSIAA